MVDGGRRHGQANAKVKAERSLEVVGGGTSI